MFAIAFGGIAMVFRLSLKRTFDKLRVVFSSIATNRTLIKFAMSERARFSKKYVVVDDGFLSRRISTMFRMLAGIPSNAKTAAPVNVYVLVENDSLGLTTLVELLLSVLIPDAFEGTTREETIDVY